MNRGELFQRVNQKFIHVNKPCVSGPKGLLQCSRASSQPAVIPVAPGLPNKLPAHPLGMSYVHQNFWPTSVEEWVNVRKSWPIHGQFRGEREDPQSWSDPLLSVWNGSTWLCSQALPCKIASLTTQGSLTRQTSSVMATALQQLRFP